MYFVFLFALNTLNEILKFIDRDTDRRRAERKGEIEKKKDRVKKKRHRESEKGMCYRECIHYTYQ